MTTATEPDEGRQWGLVSSGAAFCLILGYLLPWVYVEVAHGRLSFAGFDLPLLRWLAAAWISLLITFLFLGHLRRRRVICISAAVVSVLSGVATLALVGVVHESPRVIRRDLLPQAARAYVPGISVGPGLPVLAIGYLLTGASMHFALGKSRQRNAEMASIPALSPPDDDDGWKETKW